MPFTCVPARAGTGLRPIRTRERQMTQLKDITNQPLAVEMMRKMALEHTRSAYEALFEGQVARAAYELRFALEAQLAFDTGREADFSEFGYNMPAREESLVAPVHANLVAAGIVKHEELVIREPLPDWFPQSLREIVEKDGKPRHPMVSVKK